MDLLQKWLKEHQTVDEIQQVVGMEQFLNTLPLEKRLWVLEKKLKTCIEAGELVDEYERIRLKEPTITEAAAKKSPDRVTQEGRQTAVRIVDILKAYAGRSQGRKKDRDQDATSAERRALLGREEAGKQNKGAIQNSICQSGTVKGQTKILLDNTRCSKTMVSNRLVPLENYLEGKGGPSGDRCEESKAHRGSSSGGEPNRSGVARDRCPELFQMLGRHSKEMCPQDVMIMTTRVQQQLEEEILRKEKERAAGARPRLIAEESNNGSPMLYSEIPKRENPVVAKPKGILDISTDELQRLQEHDSTLANIR
eukprot:Em0003g899a